MKGGIAPQWFNKYVSGVQSYPMAVRFLEDLIEQASELKRAAKEERIEIENLLDAATSRKLIIFYEDEIDRTIQESIRYDAIKKDAQKTLNEMVAENQSRELAEEALEEEIMTQRAFDASRLVRRR